MASDAVTVVSSGGKGARSKVSRAGVNRKNQGDEDEETLHDTLKEREEQPHQSKS